jgi:hypothetical protein
MMQPAWQAAGGMLPKKTLAHDAASACCQTLAACQASLKLSRLNRLLQSR